ncbi:SPASM domain-containing protein [Polyangium mundeleinium]|uniref:SPASM domain-containing protein n=1 Tax=Polyangium mundeleinium TaxID=2995306 RepID=A0ABT5EME9_9BACT|nr:SPASM domain-containing protein [Polyangium mundeleinium]MDC0742941.1 SPASM domain-containing protein [Polyangium mundeleinium]
MLRERVKSIELELHSYCPKQCDFCPNSLLERNEKVVYTEERVIDEIIRAVPMLPNLRRMAFHRYNEPFIHRGQTAKINAIIAKIKEVHRGVEFWAASNLSFLSEGNNFLRDSQLHFMMVRRYEEKDPSFEAMVQFVDVHSVYTVSPGNHILFLHDGKIVYYHDVTVAPFTELYDRGGSLVHLSTRRRTQPCNRITINLGIDYNGNVMPCSNMQSQVPAHEPHILGNLRQSTLLEILGGEPAASFYEATANADFPPACRSCQSKNVIRRFPGRRGWCTCGRSRNLPYCDETHIGNGGPGPWEEDTEL